MVGGRESQPNSTRWAPKTSHKYACNFIYMAYFARVTNTKGLFIGVITLFIPGSGPPCMN